MADPGTPVAIAHRGDPRSEPENTLAAFHSAVHRGADMIELDLKRAGDGTIVVLHDDTLVRLWGIERPVQDMSAAQISAVGTATRGIPTFERVLTEIELPLMVDFTDADVVPGALGAVTEAGALDRSLFVTANVAALFDLRARSPEARLGLTWTQTRPPGPEVLASLGAEYFNPMFLLVDRELVDSMHEQGYSVSTWTVDEPETMAEMIEAGVDAIVSNEIARLRTAIDEG